MTTRGPSGEAGVPLSALSHVEDISCVHLTLTMSKFTESLARMLLPALSRISNLEILRFNIFTLDQTWENFEV